MKILFLALSDDVHGLAGNSIHIRELAKALDSLDNSIYLMASYNENMMNDIEFMKYNMGLHENRDVVYRCYRLML